MKICFKIMLSLLLVSLSGILLVSGISLFLAQNFLIHARGEQLHAVVSSQKRNIVHVLGAWEDRLNLITSPEQLRRTVAEQGVSFSAERQEQMNRILFDAIAATRAITFLEICDLAGNEIVTTRTDAHSEDAHCQEIPKEAHKITDPKLLFWEKHDDQLDAVMVAPIKSDDGSNIAILLAHMATNEILKVTQNYDGLGDTGETLFVHRSIDGGAEFLTPLRHDSDGVFFEKIISKEKTEIPTIQALLKNETILIERGVTDYRGVPVLAATAYIPEFDLGLAAKIDREEALRPTQGLLFANLGFAAIVTIFVMIVGFFISRSLSSPIVRLANIADKVKEGDLSQKTDVVTQDEIGHLGGAFNAMISSLREKEEKLKESEKHITTIMNTVVDAIITIDDKGIIETVNAAAEKLFGYDRKNLIGKNVSVLMPERFSAHHDSYIKSYSKTGEAKLLGVGGELECKRADGSAFFAQVGLDEFELNGEKKFVGTLYDLTERKKAQSLLIAGEQKFRTMYDSSPIGMALCTMDGMLIEVNQAFGDIIGYTPKECLELSYWDITPERYAKQEKEQLNFLKKTGKYGPYEKHYRHKDGHEIPVLLRGIKVVNAEGTEQIWSFIEDIEERKQSEQKIKDSEVYLKTIMDTVLDAIITIDDKGIIKTVNAATRILFRYEEEDLIGKNVNILMPDPYAKYHDSYMKNYLDTGHARVIGIGREVDAMRSDGSVFPAYLGVHEFELKGKRKFVGSIRDMTEQKKREEAEKERHKMESLAGLAGGLAHEINNALQPILGLSEAMRDKFAGEDEKVARCMAKINDNTLHARNIVRDILAFARKEKQEKENFEIKDLLENTIDFADEFIPSGIKLDVNIDIGEEPVHVYVHQTGMVQIFANLLKNASHAMGDSGVITIDCFVDKIEGEEASNLSLPEGAYTIMSVADTGCGMDEETLNKIFEPFYTTKPIGVGTGLGLSAVHGILTQWGGTIKAESEIGKGTKFFVYIPIVSPDFSADS